MGRIEECIQCYSHPVLREVLKDLSNNESIGKDFFLTGGTALSVFYLHHRTSIDLDLFTVKKVSLEDINLWITRKWGNDSRRLQINEFMLRTIIKDVRVDIIYDPISFDEKREKWLLGEEKYVTVDSIRNIVSNKLTAMVSRCEAKDFIDFFFISKMISGMDFDQIYEDAKKKDAMFDDSPMVAYQMENHLNILKNNPYSFPDLLVQFDKDEFFKFFEGIVDKIYHKVKNS